ncbi:MAG: hypothetical protein IPM35_26090 [Myxococcales bacterium]|nr:hypothetical protein [Myxococcales bacterium]
MAGDAYRTLEPRRAPDTSRLGREIDLARSARWAGASLLGSSAWVVLFATQTADYPAALRVAVGVLPFVAAGVMAVATWFAARALSGRRAVVRWSPFVLALADVGCLCWLLVGASFEVLVAHFYLASALAVSALATQTVAGYLARRYWSSACSALAAVAFVGLFARMWLAWELLWSLSFEAQRVCLVSIAASLGVGGFVALTSLEPPRIAHEEIWIDRGRLPARETARLVTFSDGATQVFSAHAKPRVFVGLADAVEWLRENDFIEEDPARFAQARVDRTARVGAEE